MYHKFVKQPTVKNKKSYKKYKKFVDKHRRLAQSKYYKRYFELHAENSKMQWSMLNNLLGRKSSNTDPIKLQDSNGKFLTSPLGVASRFNDYFTNIAANLKSQVVNFDPGGFREFLHNPVENSIEIKAAEPGEIHSIIKNFKNHR